ncbi:hypothetical protein EZS27_028852 [termite gut metagenome]|uniref:Virulence-associated protein E-like domain-containing protein n=1 Tax=termite gut metagenome TaxID=433724 RepID=A0A5J4QI40_9ZZZZ
MPITEKDIYLHLIDEGISCSKSMLNAILTSPNQVDSYNPVIEYFDSLKNSWDGNEHIDRLCGFLKAHDFEDREDSDYYQKRLNRLVKKWIVSAVACVYGIRPNDVMLGFVNAEGGIGKTTLIQSFVPKCLEEYYIASDKEAKMFRISPSFAMKFIINFDEFVCLTKATKNEFKSNMSRLRMDIKHPGENFLSQVPRIASCMFTSEKTQEKGGFLFTSDSGFLRRIATIRIRRDNKRTQRRDRL